MIGILIVLALYSALFIYEIGHIFAMRINRITADEIVVGFGPKLFSVKREKTNYIIKLIPLGSYTRVDTDEELENGQGINDLSCIRKVFILFSGIIFSFIVMIIIKSIIRYKLNIENGILDAFNWEIRHSTNYIINVYKTIYEIALSKEITLISFLRMNIISAINNLGIGGKLFLYLLANILGIFVSINIIPLPILSGGQAVLEIIKGIFKVDFSESLDMVNIVSFILVIVFLIYLII